MTTPAPEVLYANISADNERTNIAYKLACVMDSVCPSCEESGKTTLLMTKIPFF
jgi:hypothetical protein